MNAKQIRAAVTQYMVYERRAKLVMFERTPRYSWCYNRPDVIAVFSNRKFAEVEIKCSIQDYWNDFSKPQIANRSSCIGRWPHYYYYAFESSLADQMISVVPDYAGLLSVRSNYIVDCIKKSQCNNNATKLSLNECVQCAKLLSNTLAKAAWHMDMPAHAAQPPCHPEPMPRAMVADHTQDAPTGIVERLQGIRLIKPDVSI